MCTCVVISLAVNDALTSGALPTDTNAVYFVLTSSEIAESSGFCTQVSRRPLNLKLKTHHQLATPSLIFI